MNSKIRSKICCLIEFCIYRGLQTANGYERFSSKYIHEYIISINIMVITNIEITTQYIQDKTTHIYTETHTP